MLNAAVIGVGNMGKHHARVFSNLRGVCLTAVSDIDSNVVKRVAGNFDCKAYTDYEEMIKNENLDIVSVVVPTKLHAKIAIDTVKAGIHTIVEKPIADTLENAKKIILAARENKVKLSVGHIERFNPAVSELKKLVTAGKLGKISSIMAKRVGYFPSTPIDVNVLIEVGIHDIDIFNYILGKLPTGVYASGGKTESEKFKEDYVNVLLDYNDVSALLEVNWITPLKIRRLEVTGSKAFAELNYISQDLVVHHVNKSSIQGSKRIYEKIEIVKREPLKLELEHFAECVLKDRVPLNDGESAYHALNIAHKAIEFLNKNKQII